MRCRSAVLISTALALLAVATPALAELIGLDLNEFPDIFSSFINTSYAASTDRFLDWEFGIQSSICAGDLPHCPNPELRFPNSELRKLLQSVMPVPGISELVLHVRDAERVAQFYRDVVGLAVDQPFDGNWAWFWTGKPEHSARLAVQSGPLLFEEHSPHPPDDRWGRVHFALTVDRADIESRLRRLREHDVEVHGPIDFEWMRARSWYFYDPEGNLAELWSPEPD